MNADMSSHALVYASTNPAKLAEACTTLASFGLRVEGLQSVIDNYLEGSFPKVSEPHISYQDNAGCKAAAYSSFLNRCCISDDAGIEIEELGDLPGVYTAHFEFERIRRSLYPLKAYSARMVCCAAYAEPTGRVVSVLRWLEGVVKFPVEAMKPNSSVPYSHFFIPNGEQHPLAELMQNTGGFLSHRVLALRSLCRSLELASLKPV